MFSIVNAPLFDAPLDNLISSFLSVRFSELPSIARATSSVRTPFVVAYGILPEVKLSEAILPALTPPTKVDVAVEDVAVRYGIVS